eukprot:s4764_g3.t1
MGKEKDEWDLLEKLPVKELRRQAARKCVPLTQISTAVEKSDLINLIIKAGPVLDQYDVSVGVKVWTAEAVDSHQPGAKKPVKTKDKRMQKDQARLKDAKEAEKSKKKKKRGSSSSEEASEQKKKKRKKSKSKKNKGGQAVSRSPSLTMMLPADAPLQLAKTESGRSLATRDSRASRSPSLTMLADAPSVTDLEVCIIESHEPGTKVPQKKDKERQPKKNKDKGEEVEKTRKKKGRSRSPSLAVAVDAPPQVTDGEARKAQAGSADTAQAGVAAAAALGFNVLPKQSSYAPNAPAPGLRPSLHAPTALPTPSSTSLGHRVCVQYLCFTRCDRGSNCPEAHIMDPEEEMRVRAKFKMQECNQGANCTRTSCLFRHPGERVEEASLSGSQLQKATPQSGITR